MQINVVATHARTVPSLGRTCAAVHVRLGRALSVYVHVDHDVSKTCNSNAFLGAKNRRVGSPRVRWVLFSDRQRCSDGISSAPRPHNTRRGEQIDIFILKWKTKIRKTVHFGFNRIFAKNKSMSSNVTSPTPPFLFGDCCLLLRDLEDQASAFRCFNRQRTRHKSFTFIMHVHWS